MKVLHVVGARPNFMKVAPVMAALGKLAGLEQALVHTGQHFDANMSAVFFDQLGIPSPEINLEVGSGSHAAQTAAIMTAIEPVLVRISPDLVVVYGDVNSTVAAALVCAKLLIPVAHVEAGLRSRDRTMPEEINRILTDQIAELLLTPSEDGNANLRAEGIPEERIRMVGNIMIDSLNANLERARGSTILNELNLEGKDYGVLTLHRPSNVDERVALLGILNALKEIGRRVPIIFPAHPRTRKMIDELELTAEFENAKGLVM